MDRFLGLPPEQRVRAFQQASAEIGWSPESVEKDFWVCLVLRELFALPDHGPTLTFKGGTSLSKAWTLIDRFSEDVDLTLGRDVLGFDGERAPEMAVSRKELRHRLDALTNACRREVQRTIAGALRNRLAQLLSGGAWVLELDADDPDQQTLLFTYPRTAPAGAGGYLAPSVKLEFGARSDPWPTESREVVSIVAEAFPALFTEPTVRVQALRPERTFWEKAMLLHEERHRPPQKARRARMARHYYDLWRLIETGVATAASGDTDLFDRVARHREVYFRQNWMNYDSLRRGSLQVLPAPEQEAGWRADYNAMRAAMFAGEPPPFDVILDAIRGFQESFNNG